jgi:hypothetical protein
LRLRLLGWKVRLVAMGLLVRSGDGKDFQF